MVSNIPWIVKYSPKNLSDFKGHKESIAFFKHLILNFNQGDKFIFLYGGYGNGKTSAVYALANTYNYEVVELNASDVRKAAVLEERLSSAINQGSLFGNNKIILIDEIEGLSGIKDRGAIPTIVKIAQKSKFPIVVIAHDAYDRKLKALRKKSESIKFEQLDIDTIKEILKNILVNENISFEEKALSHIARVSGGDVRSAINDLQNLGTDISLDAALTLGERDTKVTINQALNIIYKTSHPDIALRALDNVNVDLDKVFLWIEENTPFAYLNPDDLQRAFENIAIADKFFGRIRRWQYYRFYVYCYALLTAGISLSKNKKYSHDVQYKESSRLLKIWIANRANAKKNSIAKKLAEATHTSLNNARNQIDYIKFIVKKNAKSKIPDFLELNNEELEWLKK